MTYTPPQPDPREKNEGCTVCLILIAAMAALVLLSVSVCMVLFTLTF